MRNHKLRASLIRQGLVSPVMAPTPLVKRDGCWLVDPTSTTAHRAVNRSN